MGPGVDEPVVIPEAMVGLSLWQALPDDECDQEEMMPDAEGHPKSESTKPLHEWTTHTGPRMTILENE